MVVCLILALSAAVIATESEATGTGWIHIEEDGNIVTVSDSSEPKDFENLQAAVKYVNESTAEEVVIICEKEKAIEQGGQHAFLTRSVTVEGNNAHVVLGGKAGECDFAIDAMDSTGTGKLMQDTTLTIDSLHNISVWGWRVSQYTFNLVMLNCNTNYNGITENNGARINVQGANGINNITVKDCVFGSNSEKSTIKSDTGGTLVIDNCRFEYLDVPINIKTDLVGGSIDISVKNTTFVNCGIGSGTGDGCDSQYAAPIRVVNASATNGSDVLESSVKVQNCTFTYTGSNVPSNGDILIGDGRYGKKYSHPVSLEVVGTEADIQWQGIGYYTSATKDDLSKSTDKNLFSTASVDEDEVLIVEDGLPTTVKHVVTLSGEGGSASVSSCIVSSGMTFTASGSTLKVGSCTISAIADFGYIFSEWIGIDGAITGDTTVTAKFTRSSSGTVVIETDTTTTTVTKTGDTASVVTEINEDKVTDPTTMEQAIQEAVDQIAATEKTAGASEVVKQVVIPATKDVEVSAISVAAIKDSGADLAVKTEAATVAVKTDALTTLYVEDKPIKIVVDPESDLSSSQKSKVGSNQYIDVTAFVGDKQVHSLGGSAVITVPCTLSGNVKVSYVDDNGNISDVPCTYSDGVVTFTTDHFSVFMISAISSAIDYDDDYYPIVPVTPAQTSDNDGNTKIIVACAAAAVAAALALTFFLIDPRKP